MSRGGRGEAVADTIAVCAEFGAPVLSVDPERRTGVVEPGIVLDELNRQLADRHLQFGPKPSPHSHCPLGGTIGDDACGGSAQAYGKTVDDVRRLELLTYDGTRCWVGPTSAAEYDGRARIRARCGSRRRARAGSWSGAPGTARPKSTSRDGS
ncbi:FAD linked oxidase domain-containing protein [Actinobacteria bacterium OK074]|nr:FAD linked oxidase domain-containing protein [Actinobacteria bacterium OK074]